ncbi:LysR family transcriptional regulator [Stenotrophomonas sp. SORGH_AS_0282]|uniref:helix-turn-helix domain-containing protein n=1 Tax=Stenotrophomonas sp. SORGH_AS_0282 TaxID=3041763 RepID=UPI0027844301|nr:LysR family transcriptional regulator [Stenotrophomonas sp. SORGH_AS_0282]MDQ1188068.1 hypothetical protein [Stenotrophomonas sp. SORGH_AS_0282]
MNQLSAIRAFARVVEAGSFIRAAESLDMPTATLSKLVRELEAHLGVPPAAADHAAGIGHGRGPGLLREGRSSAA